MADIARRKNFMNYKNELNMLVDGVKGAFGYPGEMLERCGEHREEVLDAFLGLKKHQVKKLLKNEQAFNTDQIERFVDSVGSYRGELLYYLLKDEARDVRYEVVDLSGYLDLLKYLSSVHTRVDLLPDVNEGLRYLHGFTGKEIVEAVGYLESMNDGGKYTAFTRQNAKFAKLLVKGRTGVYTDKDADSLALYGYDPLSVRVLNYHLYENAKPQKKVMLDKVIYHLARQAFFGTVPMDDGCLEILNGIYIDGYKFSRAIDGERWLAHALRNLRFTDDSVNMDAACKLLGLKRSISKFSWVMSKISVPGSLFDSLSDESLKADIILERVRFETDAGRLSLLIDLFKSVSGKDILSVAGHGVYLNCFNAGVFSAGDVLLLKKCEQRSLFVELIQHCQEGTVSILEKLLPEADEDWSLPESGICYEEWSIASSKMSPDTIKRLYAVREECVYRWYPWLYKEFIISAITHTGETVHSKDEWLEILPVLEASVDSERLDGVRKVLYSEKQFKAFLEERKLADQLREKQELVEKITACKDLNALSAEVRYGSDSYYTSDLAEVIFNRAMELLYARALGKADLHKIDFIVRFYIKNLITDDELGRFFIEYKAAETVVFVA